MTCPSTAPESEIACTLDDDLDVHKHGHEARTADGQGVLVWGVDLTDYERWGATPPDELVQWAADAEAAAAAAEEEAATEDTPAEEAEEQDAEPVEAGWDEPAAAQPAE